MTRSLGGIPSPGRPRQPPRAAGLTAGAVFKRGKHAIATTVPTEHHGLHLLAVQAETGDEQQRACANLDRYGAIDIDRLTAGNGGNG